jgi:hypothetical protein
VSQITPTSVNCKEFSTGTAKTLNAVRYSVKQGLINQTDTGGFEYWVTVTAAAGSNTFVINQSITTGNFSKLFAISSGSAVYNSGCRAIKGATFTQSSTNGTTGTITATFSAPSAGTYYIKLKFDASSVVGQPPPSPSTVGYSFDTIGVPGSTAGLSLIKK